MWHTHPLFGIQINSILLPGEICHHREVGGSALISSPPHHVLLWVAGCVRERLHQKMGWNVQNGDGAICLTSDDDDDDTHLQILPTLYAATSTNHGFWVHATFRDGWWEVRQFLAGQASLQLTYLMFFFPSLSLFLSPSIWHHFSPFWN